MPSLLGRSRIILASAASHADGAFLADALKSYLNIQVSTSLEYFEKLHGFR